MRTTHDGHPVDPDYDPMYRNPRGWRNAKRDLGPDLAHHLERLERLPGCPRKLLAAAVDAFINLSGDERDDATDILGRYEDARAEGRTPEVPPEGGPVINPWPRIRRLLLRTRAHRLPEIVPHFERAAERLQMDPCLLLATTLREFREDWKGEAPRGPSVALAGEECGSAGDTGWEDVVSHSEQCDMDLTKRMPRRRVRALARRGMVVSVMNDCELAIIEQVHLDHAMVRTESGELIRQRWHEVDLHDVGPDPSELPSAWGPAMGTLAVADKSFPIRLVRGRMFHDGGCYAGFVDFDRGNVLVSDLSSLKQVANGVGEAFISLLIEWMDRHGFRHTWRDTDGVDESEELPDLDDGQGRRRAA